MRPANWTKEKEARAWELVRSRLPADFDGVPDEDALLVIQRFMFRDLDKARTYLAFVRGEINGDVLEDAEDVETPGE